MTVKRTGDVGSTANLQSRLGAGNPLGDRRASRREVSALITGFCEQLNNHAHPDFAKRM